MSFPSHTVLKTVGLRFCGSDLVLKTSHALFSSHHVDAGTLLLLKTLAQQDAVPVQGRVLDAGCGYGPLALALKKHRPALEVTARDRLVLAAEFTAENARTNNLQVDAAPGLLLDNVPGPWDLIVSNLPAKAGDPVLADFAARSLALLAPAGRVAVVIVDTLAERFAGLLAAAGAAVVYQEAGPGYRVYHYSATASVPPFPPPFPGAYLRGRIAWNPGTELTQDTYYGLPNFDALDYRLEATKGLLAGLKIRGDALVWEPVQGHLAAWAARALPPSGTLHLSGNDVLALAAAAAACARPVQSHPASTLGAVPLGAGSVAAALVQVHPEPEIPWVDEARDALLRVMAPSGWVLVNGRSTDLTRFLEKSRGFRKVRDQKVRGWRAVLLDIT